LKADITREKHVMRNSVSSWLCTGWV